MGPSPVWALRGAIGFAACLSAPALAADCGRRVFPATLGIDDPSVNDEFSLPTLTHLPSNSDGAREFDASFSWTKTIVENLGVSVTDGKTWLRPGKNGWGNLETELKYSFFCDPSHEFMTSIGLDVQWAKTGTPGFSDPFNTYSPTLDIGKGFGDLPTSFDVWRPVALTAEASLSIPGERRTVLPVGNGLNNESLNPTVLNWGFTLQYSLPYMNANIREIGGPDFVKHLIPITEFVFQTPVGNYPRGGSVTTGAVQPGVIYAAETWQLAVEALVPINRASGRNIGVVGELHFFLDEMFPNSFLGKPLFGEGS